MFRKNVSAGGTRQLGGKDVKKLRQQIDKAFSLTDADREILFPPKSSISQTKLSNRAIVYSIDGGNPLFFDPNGHGDKLLPTIYALALVPTLLPTLYTWSEVSSKVLGGADLFLQGVLVPTTGLEPFLIGTPRCLSIPGNPVPFAVGTMAVSLQEAQREGMRGKMTVLHCYGDLLWQLGDKVLPNGGFTATRIFPIQPVAAEGADVEEGEDNRLEGIGGGSEVESGIASLKISNNDNAIAMAATEAGAEAEVSTNTSTVEEEAASISNSSRLMDTLVEAAAIGGLKALKAADMPIQTSDFYTKYMQPLKPPGVTFDFKQSTYKKLSKLLDKLEKDKLCTQKSIRKQDHITSVNRAAPMIVEWKGMPTVTPTSAAGGDSTTASNSNTNNAQGSRPNSSLSGKTNAKHQLQQSKVVVEELYRAPTSLRPIFGPAAAADKDRLYTRNEVSHALQTYCQVYNTTTKCKIDQVLASGLWGKKQGPQEGEEISFDVLLGRLLEKLQLWHRLQRGDVVVTRRGGVKPIHIVAEKRFGRNITAVSRVEGFGFDAAELATSFRNKFQTSCSVSKLPGKEEKDHEIAMQGDLLKLAVAWFGEHGIDAKYIEINNKLSGKKKK